jgi:hypothetical protein
MANLSGRGRAGLEADGRAPEGAAAQAVFQRPAHWGREEDAVDVTVQSGGGGGMTGPKPILKVVLVAGGLVAGVAFVLVKLRREDEVAAQVADDIEAQFESLDPVERIVVVAKLVKDVAKDVKDVRARST